MALAMALALTGAKMAAIVAPVEQKDRSGNWVTRKGRPWLVLGAAMGFLAFASAAGTLYVFALPRVTEGVWQALIDQALAFIGWTSAQPCMYLWTTSWSRPVEGLFIGVVLLVAGRVTSAEL